MRSATVVWLVCCCLLLVACSPKDTPKVTGNKAPSVAKELLPAPDISVISVATGQTLKLSDLKGKVVVLNFWATWCPPCREEIPSMMKLNSQMAGKPFQMVAVSIDEGGKPAVEEFFKRSGNSLPAYIDPSSASSKSYGLTGVPETFVIDKQGMIVKKVIGTAPWDAPEAVAYLEGLMK